MSEIKMHNKNILVIPESNKEKFDNGLTMDVETTSRMQIVYGTVEAAPLGILVKPEQRIYYPLYGATIYSIGGKTYHIVNYDDVMMSE